MTTRGIKEAETKQIVAYMDQALKDTDNEELLAQLRNKIKEIALQFPVPGL
jgi:glycine/serine hydroxymethyltransferase